MLDDSGFSAFYERTLKQLLQEGVLRREDAVLVVCAGPIDHAVFLKLGFTRVTISSMDTRTTAAAYLPFTWSHQDAEALTFPDGAFDFCVVHSGLHHCFSPHRALLEMYRVARKGILLFEPYDNIVSRLGVALKIGQEYELAAVFCNGMACGGLRNTDIPNFVYRFTRREIVQTFCCAFPTAKPGFRFIHRMVVPWTQLVTRKNKLFLVAAVCAWPFLKLVNLIFPSICTGFGAVVLKPDLKTQLHPWLMLDGKEQVTLNRPWLEARFKQ